MITCCLKTHCNKHQVYKTIGVYIAGFKTQLKKLKISFKRNGSEIGKKYICQHKKNIFHSELTPLPKTWFLGKIL